jgi:hypothetical protein
LSFERPVICAFTVSFDIHEHPNNPLRAAVPLLLAADRFVFDLDGRLDPDMPLVWIAAPDARECVLDVLSQSGL